MTEQLYFDAPLTLEFTAQVTESRPLDGGRFGLVLPRTYFYPNSGGQEHDTGSIGEARVLDVYKENGDIVHITDKALEPGDYPARIDRERRIRAMQHHTAQHILSASFLEVADIDSLSANINGDNPSTIDLEVGEVSPDILRRAEAFANSVFFENRAVKTYNVTQEEIARLPVRKPPKVSGLIRVVEVDGFDYTPCGGTHCPNTGMVGLLKIVKTERVNQKLRVHFVAGYQALDYFNAYQDVAQRTAALLETGLDGIPTVLEHKLEQLKAAQSELETLHAGLLAAEADQLAASAQTVGSLRLVTALFRDRPAADLRSLGMKLRNVPALVALLAAYDGGKLSMVVACAKGSDLDARDLLKKHLAPFNGRGGGDVSLAQGGGVAEESALAGLFKDTKSYLKANY
ncbi:MAG: DHHA1 domain-containing protein [Anaerolineales bacterium]